MAVLQIVCTRPLLTQNVMTYAFDPAPRFVIAGVDCEGSWQRDEPLTIEVFPGPLHIAAYQARSHPVAVWVSRRMPRRPAELAIDVPADCARIVLEDRASRSAWRPGTIRVRQVIASGDGP